MTMLNRSSVLTDNESRDIPFGRYLAVDLRDCTLSNVGIVIDDLDWSGKGLSRGEREEEE